MSDSEKKSKGLGAKTALDVLNKVWAEIQALPYNQIFNTTFVDEEAEERIRLLINSRTKAFRYAIFTQVLAKYVDHSVNCLALQVQASILGAFDARSFCKKTVVPFERERLDNILCASSDPYVGKPLRHERISLEIIDHIKDKNGWKNLYIILRKIEEKSDPNFTLAVLKQILLEIRKLISQQVISSPIIQFISTEDLKEILISYLAKPSQGLRPQAVVYALFKVSNEKTSIFTKITTAKATVSDAYAKRKADIECRDAEGNLKLAICVTEKLDAEKLKSELEKAKINNVRNLLIIAHRVDVSTEELNRIVKKYTLEVAISPLVDFIVTMTVMLNNDMRKKLVLRMYEVLRELESPDNLREWDKTIRKKLGIK